MPIIFTRKGDGPQYGAGYPSVAFPVCAGTFPRGWPVADRRNLVARFNTYFGTSPAADLAARCPASIMDTRAKLDRVFLHSQVQGMAGVILDGVARDANPTAFTSVFRLYNETSPDNNLVMKPDGLHFEAHCVAGVPRGSDCHGQAGVEAGILRPLFELFPDRTYVINVCVRQSTHPADWFTTWTYRGSDQAPSPFEPVYYVKERWDRSKAYPAGYHVLADDPADPAPHNHYVWLSRRDTRGQVPGTSGNSDWQRLNYAFWPSRAALSAEVDGPDGNPRVDGRSAIHDLTPSLPDPRPDQNVAPVYAATGGDAGFVPGLNDIGTMWQFHVATDLSAMPHCRQWEEQAAEYTDGTRTRIRQHGHVVWSLDGTEYLDYQFDQTGSPELGWDGAPTGRPLTPKQLMVARQVGPAYQTAGGRWPLATAAMTPASFANDDDVLTEISIYERVPGTVHEPPVLPNALIR